MHASAVCWAIPKSYITFWYIYIYIYILHNKKTKAYGKGKCNFNDTMQVRLGSTEAAQEKRGLLGPKKEADYDFFVDVMWQKISTKEEKQRMTPNLVYQVQ